MIRLGLSSQAFPTLGTRDILKLAAETGLEGVEWDAESHLAPGDTKAAQALLMETLFSRLSIVSLAALYRVMPGAESGLGFESLLDTASALQAPILRIFAGNLSWAKADAAARTSLLEELGRLGDLAAHRGITLSLSLSRGTSLEDYRSAEGLLAGLDHAFVRLAWEPLPGCPSEEATAAIERLSRRTALILARKNDRQGQSGLLGVDAEAWGSRVSAFLAGETEPKMSRFVLLGRIGEGDETRLKDDASFLSAIIKARNPPHRG